MTDRSRNLDGAELDFVITGKKNTLSITQVFTWGAESVDVSLLPVLLQLPQPYTHFKEGDDVEVKCSAATRGEFLDVMISSYDASEGYISPGPNGTKNLYIGDRTYMHTDEVEGVEATLLTNEDAETGRNTTQAVVSITETDLEGTWGYYTFMFIGDMWHMQIVTRVLPDGVMSQLPEGEIHFRNFASGSYTANRKADLGLYEDEPGMILCMANGYPIDEITILRPNLETAYTETTLVQGKDKTIDSGANVDCNGSSVNTFTLHWTRAATRDNSRARS